MPAIWTIGHSTHAFDHFAAMLTAHQVKVLADIRRHPCSHKHPQFNAQQLSAGLTEHGIDYLPMPSLGGRRQALANSPNGVWRNTSFRGYADYMETPQFRDAVEGLETCARKNSTVLMCAEALWWSCHRALLADYLKTRGWEVLHIMDAGKLQTHPYTAAARIVDGELTYHETSALF